MPASPPPPSPSRTYHRPRHPLPPGSREGGEARARRALAAHGSGARCRSGAPNVGLDIPPRTTTRGGNRDLLGCASATDAATDAVTDARPTP
jgi:hypothetical protein